MLDRLKSSCIVIDQIAKTIDTPVITAMQMSRIGSISEDISECIEPFRFVTVYSNDGVITINGIDQWEIEKSTKLKKLKKIIDNQDK